MKEFIITFHFAGGGSIDHLKEGYTAGSITNYYTAELAEDRFMAVCDDLVLNRDLVTHFVVTEKEED